jgi:hypothetical protein
MAVERSRVKHVDQADELAGIDLVRSCRQHRSPAATVLRSDEGRDGGAIPTLMGYNDSIALVAS